MSSNVAKMENQPSQPIQAMGESSALLSVIERAASNPEVDIDKMERLMAMHERTLERQAVAVYSEALSDMQDELPAVAERGNAAGRYTYAKWEDINTAIKPVLKKYGFALSFRTDCTDGITVTGVLSHKNGHSEHTTIKLPADGSGNKNAVQAVASSVSYGKRYTAGALLNLTSHGEDDDAYAACQQVPDPAPDVMQSWMDAIASRDDHMGLKETKAEMIQSFGKAISIPKALVSAYNARWKEVEA